MFKTGDIVEITKAQYSVSPAWVGLRGRVLEDENLRSGMIKMQLVDAERPDGAEQKWFFWRIGGLKAVVESNFDALPTIKHLDAARNAGLITAEQFHEAVHILIKAAGR